MKKETGLIHIYTGTGKGKTTASVGLCLRALSQGLKVCYSYFNKNPEKYGNTEIATLKKLGAKVIERTIEHPFFDKSVNEEDIKSQTKEAVEEIDKLIHEESFDLLVMDEILISVRDGFIEEDSFLRFVENKPKNLELVLTGRGATDNIIALADYVSEVNKIKHPMDSGTPSRRGIEF